MNMAFAYHPSLKNTLKGCQEWLAHPTNQLRPERYIGHLQQWLNENERPAMMRGRPISDLSHYYGIAACDAYRRGDAEALARLLDWTVHLRALDVRRDGTFSAQYPDEGHWPAEFWDSMKAAGPVMLSQWELGATCAERFLQMAEKDQRVNQLPATRMLNHNTNDVFLIGLFSQAFDRPTTFTPRLPLIEPYQQLLEVWRTSDEAAFQAAMQTASEFHIRRSTPGGKCNFSEFQKSYDRVFAAELLAVMALRQRDGLPAFAAGHLLVDGPWQVISQLPEAAPDPLLLRVEAQLKLDYPDFR